MRLVSCFVLGLATVQPGALSAQNTSAPLPLPSVTLPAALDRVLRDYERHWRAGNADSLAALFAGDGFVLQPGRPPVRGLEGIAAAYRRNPGAPLELRALAFAAADTVGYIIGAFGMQRDGPDAGKFILALRRSRDGSWKIAADMDNGNSRD